MRKWPQFPRCRSALELQASERVTDQRIRKVDDALDALLAVPSPSVAAFGQKLQILSMEYGLQVQPRHIAALYADAILMAWFVV